MSRGSSSWCGHEGPIEGGKGDFTVIDCAVCGFAHIVPVPTADELASVYRHDYYTVEKPLYLEEHSEDAEWWTQTYSERYDLLERSLPDSRRRLLDVGSGPGYFLKTGIDRGWSAEGIEPSTRAAAHARGLGARVTDGFFDPDSAAQLGSFDVVHMSEVLEHIPDPHGLVETAVSIVKPGGLLYAMVPNDFNPLQLMLQEELGYDPWWLAPPHHINYFNRHSLCGLFEAHGLEVIHTEVTFPMEFFLLMGVNYIGNDSLGRDCHAKRQAFEQSFWRAERADLKGRLYDAFGQLELGRLVGVLGRKSE